MLLCSFAGIALEMSSYKILEEIEGPEGLFFEDEDTEKKQVFVSDFCHITLL